MRSKPSSSSLATRFDLAHKQQRIHELDELMLGEGFWNNRNQAQALIREKNELSSLLNDYAVLNQRYGGMDETLDLLKQDFDPELFDLVEQEVLESEALFEAFEIKVLLSEPYDHANAILELHPGAGGTESQDWAEMLYRMYTRYAEQQGFKVKVLDYQEGDEAGRSCWHRRRSRLKPSSARLFSAKRIGQGVNVIAFCFLFVLN